MLHERLEDYQSLLSGYIGGVCAACEGREAFDGVRVRTGTAALRFSLIVVWIAFDGQASSPSG